MNNKINKNNIKTIQFVFENLESLTIPVECFKYFDIDVCTNGDNVSRCSIEAIIESIYSVKLADFRRINKYNDITLVSLEYFNGDKISYRTIWKNAGWNGDENLYQVSELSWCDGKIELSISEKNICVCRETNSSDETNIEIYKDNKNWILRKTENIGTASILIEIRIDYCPYCGRQLS